MSENETSFKPGNVAGVIHGNRTRRMGCVHAKLGRRFKSQYGDVNRLRRSIEQAAGLLDDNRPLKDRLLGVARCQTMLRAEEGCRSLELLIRENPDMEPGEVARLRHLIMQFSCQRDNVLRELLGEGDSGDVVSQLYGQPGG